MGVLSFDAELQKLQAWLQSEGGSGLTVAEAAKLLGVTRMRIAQLTARRAVNWTRFFQTVVISRRSLQQYRARPVARKGRVGPRTPWKTKFLAELRRTRNVTAACRHVGISPQSVNDQKRRDALFRAEWEKALAAPPGEEGDLGTR